MNGQGASREPRCHVVINEYARIIVAGGTFGMGKLMRQSSIFMAFGHRPASVTAAALLLMQSACTDWSGPSDAQIRQAYSASLSVEAQGTGIAPAKLPPGRGVIVAVNAADCRRMADSIHYRCPVTVADEEANAQRDTHRRMLILIKTEARWMLEGIE